MGLAILNAKKNEALFGLDIGQTSMKVMQLGPGGGEHIKVTGYGVSQFYSNTVIKDGQITDPKKLATALNELLDKELVGSITAQQVACTLPTAHTYTHPMKMPKMAKTHLDEAIELEVEQFIPLPPDKLYIDHDIINEDEENIDLLVVAAPRVIVDSYVNFLQEVGLQPVALEPSMNASARLHRLLDPSQSQPSILIDFGSVSIDIAVFDKTMFVNSTIQGGSDTLTDIIAKHKGISNSQAYYLKNQEGIAKPESNELLPLMEPLLNGLIREVRKIVRYYEDRTGQSKKIASVVTTGGGSTLKGLNEFLSKELKIPTAMLNPWSKFDFGDLQKPSELVSSMFLTVAGEAMLTPEEILR